MAYGCPIVTVVGISQGSGGVEEEEVVLLAVVDEPEVPHPSLGEAEHFQPFTPEEAMELMKERWKAMNMISTGTVMMLAYAISWPQETFSCLK